VSAIGHAYWIGTTPLPVEITDHTDAAWVQWLVPSVITFIATLGGVWLAQRYQWRTTRYSAIRKDRIERILDFLDAAHDAQHAAYKRFQGQPLADSGSRVHRLWLREKGVVLVCGKKVRDAAKEFATKLTKAVEEGTGGQEPKNYYENEEVKFLQEAQSEMAE
jgi:hypothetical protein